MRRRLSVSFNFIRIGSGSRQGRAFYVCPTPASFFDPVTAFSEQAVSRSYVSQPFPAPALAESAVPGQAGIFAHISLIGRLLLTASTRSTSVYGIQ